MCYYSRSHAEMRCHLSNKICVYSLFCCVKLLDYEIKFSDYWNDESCKQNSCEVADTKMSAQMEVTQLLTVVCVNSVVFNDIESHLRWCAVDFRGALSVSYLFLFSTSPQMALVMYRKRFTLYNIKHLGWQFMLWSAYFTQKIEASTH